MNKQVKKAIEVLKQGGIVIFPTDTAFGIGCVVDDEKAVEKLFRIRKRPENKATPVLVDTVKMAQNYLQPIPKDVVDRLIEPYWPGGLTIVLQSLTEKVPNLVRGGGQTIGVRIPAHPVARAIIRGVGKPILGPSANFAGEKTPHKLSDLNPELRKLVDFVVEEESFGKMASTVIDCSVNPWKIVRQGAVILGSVVTPESPRDPGQARMTKGNMIKVIIDTSNNLEVTVGVEINRKRDQLKEKIGRDKAQVVLPLLEKLLKKHKKALSDIAHIEVNEGPGSFTGLRVGVSIANALSYALHVPVNNKKIGLFVEPRY